MIISFNGNEGSGKSTIAKKLAKELKYPRHYMGQIFRDKAREMNMTLVEYLDFLKLNPDKERDNDSYILKIAGKEKDFIIEGRVAWHFLPASIKIYLKVDPKEASKRIYKHLQEDNTRNEDTNLSSPENILKSILQRKSGDDKRYFDLYGVHIHDPKNYDLVLDTTGLSIQEVFEKVMEFIESRKNK